MCGYSAGSCSGIMLIFVPDRAKFPHYNEYVRSFIQICSEYSSLAYNVHMLFLHDRF